MIKVYAVLLDLFKSFKPYLFNIPRDDFWRFFFKMWCQKWPLHNLIHSEAFYTVDDAIQVFDILLKSYQQCLKHESMKQTIKNYLLSDMHMYQAFWWPIQLLVYILHNDSTVSNTTEVIYLSFYYVNLYVRQITFVLILKMFHSALHWYNNNFWARV